MVSDSPADSPPPADRKIDVQAVDLDPTRRGYQITQNYAVRFWLPILKPLAFVIWQALISFCFGDRESCWPSISLLAAMATGGDRKRITGRWRGKGDDRRRQPGPLEDLERFGLLTVETKHAGPETRYTFHVLKDPPFLPPHLLATLPKRLRRSHADLLEQCGMDISTYQQLAGAQDPTGEAQDTKGGAQDTRGEAPDTTKQYIRNKRLEEMWREAKSALFHEMTEANFRTYIAPTHAIAFDRERAILIIQTPNPLTTDTLRRQFRPMIMRTIKNRYLQIDGIAINEVQFQSKR